MEKKFVEKEIRKEYSDKPFKFKDIKKTELEDEDIIISQYIEPYYSENNSWDGHYSLSIIRLVLETDEEFQKRIETNKREKEWLKERRRQSYIKLKKEFENEVL